MIRRIPVNDRAGVTLSFSGFFLVFAGLTLTCMGWLYYTRNGHTFDWSQVLGPILMGIGVIFLLLAAWRLRSLMTTELSPRPVSSVAWKESAIPVMPPSYDEAIAETALRPLPSLPALPPPAGLPSQPGPGSGNPSNALPASPAQTGADKPDG